MISSTHPWDSFVHPKCGARSSTQVCGRPSSKTVTFTQFPMGWDGMKKLLAWRYNVLPIICWVNFLGSFGNFLQHYSCDPKNGTYYVTRHALGFFCFGPVIGKFVDISSIRLPLDEVFVETTQNKRMYYMRVATFFGFCWKIISSQCAKVHPRPPPQGDMSPYTHIHALVFLMKKETMLRSFRN